MEGLACDFKSSCEFIRNLKKYQLIMNILLLGSGGREHALAWKMRQSPLCQKLFIAPGNAGTAQVGENVDMQTTDFQGIKNFILKIK